MRRPSPQRQQGFGLLAFVIITMIVALTLVVGYSGVLTRIQANQLPGAQAQYLTQVQSQVLAYYERHAYFFDEVSMSNNRTIDELLDGAYVRKRFGLQGAVSRVLLSAEGTPYRAIAVWLPTETDGENPPDINRFVQTGTFVSCSNAQAACDTRRFAVFDSLDIQRELARRTVNRLQRIALKAQSYFKARTLQDPERNVSVNYFRKPGEECVVLEMDLGCLDTYQPLATLNVNSVTRARAATVLGLSEEELVSGWGLPIEASNLQDSQTDDTPYTMVFRARTPAGTYLSVRAIQQI